jgi:hypothetical protein
MSNSASVLVAQVLMVFVMQATLAYIQTPVDRCLIYIFVLDGT